MPRKTKEAVPPAPPELSFQLVRQADAMAALGGISRWTLNREVAKGELAVVYVGETPMFDIKELERYVRRHTVRKGNESTETARSEAEAS